MGRKRKIIFSFLLFLVVILASLSAFIYYYYSHPSKVKPLLEKTISQSMGVKCKIDHLSYSFHPLKLRAKGIVVTPLTQRASFRLKIPLLSMHVKLEGPFGRKVLVIDSFELNSFSLHISKMPKLSGIKRPKKQLPGRLLSKLFALVFFRGVRFGTGEANGGEISAHFEDKDVQFNNIRAGLSSDHFLKITCGARAKWSPQHRTLLVPSILITADNASDFLAKELKGTLYVRGASIEAREGRVKEAGIECAFTYLHRSRVINFQSLKVRLEGVHAKRLLAAGTPELSVYLESMGSLYFESRKIRVSSFRLNMANFLKSSGTMEFDFGKKQNLRLTALQAQIRLGKVISMLPRISTWVSRGFSFGGSAKITGNLEGVKSSDRWEWIYNLNGFLEQNPLSYTASQTRVSGAVGGNLALTGKSPDLSLSAKVRADQVDLAWKSMGLRHSRLRLSFVGKYPLFTIKALELQIPEAHFSAGKKDVVAKNIRAYLERGILNLKKGTLSLPALSISSSLLQNLLVSVDTNKTRTRLTLKGQNVRLLDSARILHLLPIGWSFNAGDDLELVATLERAGDWKVISKLDFKALDFESQDGSTIAEGLSVGVGVSLRGNFGSSLFSASVKVNATRGEALYDRFYANLSDNPFFAALDGKGDISQNSFRFWKIDAGLKNMLRVAASGVIQASAENRRIQLAVKVPATRLEPVFRAFVKEPFQEETPFLATLNLKGDISARFEIELGQHDLSVRGNLFWQEGSVDAAGGKISLKGINLDLPLWYERSSAVCRSTAKTRRVKRPEPVKGLKREQRKMQGCLDIKSLRLPYLPEQSMRLPLSASKNMIRVISPLVVKVPGGKLEIGYIILKNLSPFAPCILTSVSFSKVDLGPLLSKKWSRPVKCYASGRLDPVKIRQNSIESKGEIRANLFGGEVRAYGFGITGSLVSAPVFHLNAEWNNIQLGQVTEGTSFGKIQGIMNGYVKDLEIAFGQPQKFDLLLETAKKKGIPQKISVRAIDNIAQIGGGHSPFVGLAGIMTSFFKELPYEKIGVHATLHNDIFKINGTIKENGREYIVKRGGFSGVNVINQNPDNLISFKDMVERIKRVTAPKGGPIVK